MPFDKLLQPRYADDPEQRPLLLWVAGDTYEHDPGAFGGVAKVNRD